MYTRILLKLSGELLAGEQGFGVNPRALESITAQIAACRTKGIEIGVVIGGGNIFRGSALIKNMQFPEPKAHQMGMVGTVINGMALETALRMRGVAATNYAAFTVDSIAKRFMIDSVLDEIRSQVLIFTGGTGNPFFSTDTAAALRASEIGAQVLIKATKVDGVYNKDPKKHDDAVRFSDISYDDYLAKNLGVMDATAVSLCRDRRIPIVVFDFSSMDNLHDAVTGACTHSCIH